VYLPAEGVVSKQCGTVARFSLLWSFIHRFMSIGRATYAMSRKSWHMCNDGSRGFPFRLLISGIRVAGPVGTGQVR